MSEIKSLYLNGLGDGTLRRAEFILLERQRRNGIDPEPAHINWRSDETFGHLKDRIADKVGNNLKRVGSYGRFLIEASSAGVSLAINIAHEMNDERVVVLGHSGRIKQGEQRGLEWRTMEWQAHLGSDEESRSFYESVLACETTVSEMTPDEKSRVLLTVPYLDQVVPVNTMFANGIRTVHCPLPTHQLSIGWGLHKAPELIGQLTSEQAILNS